MSKENGSKSKIIIVIGAVVIIVLIGIIVYLVAGSQEPKRNVVVNNENVEDVIEEMQKEEEKDTSIPTHFNATMNAEWRFKDGSSPSENAYVENSERNSTDIYFDVIRTDTNETIYESPVLPVGTHIENLSLSTDLEAGTYDCVVVYHLLDENQETLSEVNFSITIIVEN